LHWTAENDNLRQIDVLPEQMERELSAWKPKHVIARLHCVSFPTNLRVRVTPQRSLIQVEPTYQVFVSENQLALEATLNYRTRGRKLELLEVELGDWKLPTIGPESLVRQEAVVNENGVHLVPLQQATGGDFTMKLRATQQLKAARGSFNFALPRISTSQPEREQLTVAPAVLALIADDNVVVSPMIDQIQGLTPEASASLESLPEREQPPRYYRQRGDNGTASEFAGHLQVMPQSVAVESLIEIVPAAGGYQVDIRFQYTVRHKPLEWLLLEVPSALVAPEAIGATLQLDGEPIIPTLLPQEEGIPRTALLTLPAARQGAFELQVSYLWKAAAAEQSAQEQAVVELVQPERGATYASSMSRLMLGGQNRLRLAEASPWKRVAEGQPENSAAKANWQYETDQLVSKVSLQQAAAEKELLRQTVVKVAWYQTWLTTNRRRDRAVFRVESSQENVELPLPPAGELEQMEVVVNGRIVDSLQVLAEQNILVVSLPPTSAEGELKPREYVIELMVETAARRSSHLWQGGLARFHFPQLKGSDPERVYWQLVLPSNEFLWFEPEGVTSESELTLPTWLAPARPTLTQADLEQYSRAVSTPPPAAGANVYLFSGFGQIEQLNTGIVQRRAVVLLGAGLVLALALPLIYVPLFRGWKALLAAGTLLLLLGLAYPYPAQLLGSSVVAGCLLLLLARFLQITLSRRRQGPRILPPRDSMLGQATQPAYTLESEGNSVGSSHGTTATAPAIYSPNFGKPEASS
jgi:membrane protein implicated in regulation of membrane protease activity